DPRPSVRRGASSARARCGSSRGGPVLGGSLGGIVHVEPTLPRALQRLRAALAGGETVEAQDLLPAGERDERHAVRLPRLEPHRRARRDVEAVAERAGAVVGERTVGLEEVEVRTDLHGTVAGV